MHIFDNALVNLDESFNKIFTEIFLNTFKPSELIRSAMFLNPLLGKKIATLSEFKEDYPEVILRDAVVIIKAISTIKGTTENSVIDLVLRSYAKQIPSSSVNPVKNKILAMLEGNVEAVVSMDYSFNRGNSFGFWERTPVSQNTQSSENLPLLIATKSSSNPDDVAKPSEENSNQSSCNCILS